MNSFDIRDLVKAAVTVVLLSIAIGKFGELRDFALVEGIKAVSTQGYRPTYFFANPSSTLHAAKKENNGRERKSK